MKRAMVWTGVIAGIALVVIWVDGFLTGLFEDEQSHGPASRSARGKRTGGGR